MVRSSCSRGQNEKYSTIHHFSQFFCWYLSNFPTDAKVKPLIEKIWLNQREWRIQFAFRFTHSHSLRQWRNRYLPGRRKCVPLERNRLTKRTFRMLGIANGRTQWQIISLRSWIISPGIADKTRKRAPISIILLHIIPLIYSFFFVVIPSSKSASLTQICYFFFCQQVSNCSTEFVLGVGRKWKLLFSATGSHRVC